MSWRDIVHLTVDDLKSYRADHKERQYVLMDVRQPEEYAEGHLPGAKLIPLMELEPRLMQLPPDRDLVFYCRTGSRSIAAASLAAEAEITTGTVYNLLGGLTHWEGKTLPDFPNVDIFDKEAGADKLLYHAMDLEKGAWRFYRHLVQTYPHVSVYDVFEQLSKAEVSHARTVHVFWKDMLPHEDSFEVVFDGLAGEVLEGGETLQELLGRVESIKGNLCLNLLEIALNIEYAAFDLYRTLAEDIEDRGIKEALWSLAEQEKAHIRVIAKSLGRCH